MSATAVILDIGSLATAAGVATAAVQLRLSSKRALTAFEDSLSHEYRSIAYELPVEVFLNEKLPPEKLAEHRSSFYRYFDLCNEQVFLRIDRRVSSATWEQWRDGIEKNLGRTAFRDSWEQHFDTQTEGDFDELRRLMAGFDVDPASW
jgi:hypothetical protein